MGNLFIGFPVPRAKIADMIIGSAPPLEHVPNHRPDGSDPISLPGDISSGQVLKWNGTKFIGFTTGAYPPIGHFASHEPDGSDPLVSPGDISSSQIIQWNGTKFVGTDPPANGGYPSPISIHSSSLSPSDDTVDFFDSYSGLRKRSTLDQKMFYTPVFFPHDITVTKLTLYAYLSETDSSIIIVLRRMSNTGSATIMASVESDWINGDGSKYDDSITAQIINNSLYSYTISCSINPFVEVGNAILRKIMIDFT